MRIHHEKAPLVDHAPASPRPSLTSHFSLHTSAKRKAFSMLELMISIMILGIGIVMVATVFPVTMGMSRDTLQMSIALAAADAAETTARLRVPSLEDLNNDGVVPNPYLIPSVLHGNKVLLPDIKKIELDDSPVPVINEIEFYATYRNDTAPVENNALAFPDWLNWSNPCGTICPPPFWGSISHDEFVDASRAYTEATGWGGDRILYNLTAVLRSQNILAGTRALTAEEAPWVGSRDDFVDPRIHLADRVYPPVAVGFDAENNKLLNADTGAVLSEDDFVDIAANRRYAWTIIHRQVPLSDTNRAFLLTIVVTHRGDLKSRYAKQLDESSGTFQYNLSVPGDIDALRDPEPDADTADTLFPQAWLVVFDNVDPTLGQIQCTAAVARLLPKDSVYIEASGDMAGTPGTPHRILDNSLASGNTLIPDDTMVLLQIARYEGNIQAFDDTNPLNRPAVWVFPPPIVARSLSENVSAQFALHKPVVGVFMREVVIQ